VTTINLVICHQYGDDKTLRDIISESAEAKPIGRGLAVHQSVIVPMHWQVSDIETGMSVGLPAATEAEARKSAHDRLMRAIRQMGNGRTFTEVLDNARRGWAGR
jgi:hypothetical protein